MALEKAVNMVNVYEDPKADRADSDIYYIDASIFNILAKPGRTRNKPVK